MTRVKICGCIRVADAVAAAEAGADFIGIMFAESRRRVSAQEASVIARAVGTPLREMEQAEPPPLHPGRFDTIDAWFEHGASALERLLARKRPLVVGVFADQDVEEVNEIADEAGLDLVQLSGSEPWSDCLLVNRPAIKVVRQLPGTPAADMLQLTEPGGAIAVMLDPSRGTGATGDWKIAADVAERLPLWLAGGLMPENVGRAIREVRPWAIDVSSGVETAGAKDATKIAAFVQAARAADARQTSAPMRVAPPRHSASPLGTRTDRSSDLSPRSSDSSARPVAGRKASPRLAGFPYGGGYRYHIVLSSAKGTRPFASAEWARRAVTALEETVTAMSFALEAYCVMPDHVHVLVAGDAALDSSLPRFVHRYKQAVGFAFKQTTGRVLWHRSYYDHTLRENEPSLVHAAYIMANPVAAGLVELPGAWPFSGPQQLLEELAGEGRSEDLSVRVAELAIEMDRAAERQHT